MTVIDYLKVYHVDKENKIRLGENKDGGYVIMELEGNYDCYISAGVSFEESFSRDFTAKYCMNTTNSFGFDGTADDYPYDYTTNVAFFKKNINTFNDDKNTNLSHLTDKYKSIFLKMDIEGCEWSWILTLSETQLSQFKQVVIEFHGITDDSWGATYDDKVKCLEKLTKTHYLVHAHGNNCGAITKGVPTVIELTYVNKNCFKEIPKMNKCPLPIADLDYPNALGQKDINLNFYPFTDNNTFQKKIHLTCKNKESLDKTPVFTAVFNKYTQMYPDYEIKIYYDKDIYEIIKKYCPEDYPFMKNVSGVMLADTFRYLILYLEGGIYSDLDCEPIKKIETLYSNMSFHGDTTRDNNFYIYPANRGLINKAWDFHTNPCSNSALIRKDSVEVYKCLGHSYLTEKTKVILCTEYFDCPKDMQTVHNKKRICQWFMISKKNHPLFLKCYENCVENLRESYSKIMANRSIDTSAFWDGVVINTGPILITKVLNKMLPNDEIVILPQDFFCANSGLNSTNKVNFTQNSLVLHLFNGGWGKPNNMVKVFTEIYEQKIWGDDREKLYNGSSGGSSKVAFNESYITFLKKFISDNKIKTVADIGCGTFICGPLIYDDLDIKYTGYDAYYKVINHNIEKYRNLKYKFISSDVNGDKEDLVSADLCILKDVLQNWDLENIYNFMDYLTSCKKYKYILICNSSYQAEDNTSIVVGDFRPLNSKFLPLKKYNAKEIFEYNTKQVSLIELS